MIRWNALLTAMIVAGLAIGCGKDEDHEGHDRDMPAAGESGEPMGGAEHDKAGDDAFAKLSAEDAKLAKAQKTCPVSGETLGSMGTPVKVMVGDKAVFLCCKSCRKKLLADPDKYLAKLDK